MVFLKVQESQYLVRSFENFAISHLCKAMETGNKMFRKFVETRFLKKPKSIYSPVTRQRTSNTVSFLKEHI